MNNQRAREILLACRLGTTDGEDAEVRQALALAKQDPALREWFEDQLGLQKQIRDSLREVSPPPGLRERILAAERKQNRPSATIFKLWLPLAAAVALIAAGIVLAGRSREPKTWANFQARMTTIAVRQYSMDILSPDEQLVRQHFARQGTPSDFPLPEALANVPVKGGKSTTWHNNPVSMLCFNWKDSETLYLFVMEGQALAGHSLTAAPVLEQYKSNLNTASWTQNGKVYFLAAPIPPEEMRKLVGAGSSAAVSIESQPGTVIFL